MRNEKVPKLELACSVRNVERLDARVPIVCLLVSTVVALTPEEVYIPVGKSPVVPPPPTRCSFPRVF